MEDIKGCPFCHSDKNHQEVVDITKGFEDNTEVNGYQVECDVCFASGPIKNTEDEAVTAWNNAMGRYVR